MPTRQPRLRRQYSPLAVLLFGPEYAGSSVKFTDDELRELSV